jgi:hypothetical protein
MRLRFNFVALLLLLAPSMFFAQCSADPDNTFKPFTGGEDKPAGHFEWYSTAGPNHDKGGGHPDYAVERKVQNLATTTLKYSWPVGRMHNDALPGGKSDRYCYEATWPNQNKGPLNYGRGNDQTDTKVWEGSDEPKVNALWAAFSFNIDSDGSTRVVSMRVLTSYHKSTDGGFSYDYFFESIHPEPVTLKWGVEKDEALFENLKRKGLSPEFVVEGKRDLQFNSTEAPSVQFRSLNVMIGGKGLAGVDVPMFIPGRHSMAEAK